MASKLLSKNSHGASYKIKKDSYSRCSASSKSENPGRGYRGHRGLLCIRGARGRPVCISRRLIEELPESTMHLFCFFPKRIVRVVSMVALLLLIA